MDATMIRAVLCDMDGLLLDSERLSMRALAQAGAQLGADLPEAFCFSLIGCPMDHAVTLIREREGPDFPIQHLTGLHEQLLEEMVARGGMRTRPGADALLDALDRLVLPRAVVTSSSRKRATAHLGHAGILDRFDLLVTRDDVERGKPDPEPYRTGAAALGTAPDACLALEDSHNGVRSAHAAGVPVIIVPDLVQPTDDSRSRAAHVMTDLGEVAAFLLSALRR